MKFTTLLENTKAENSSLINKHGLSLCIETEGLRILFDTGPDDSFLHNAGELGIDLADIDILVVSHAHYDHGGGLGGFLKKNSKAEVYLNTNAKKEYFVRRNAAEFEYIGLDQAVLKTYRNRLSFISEKTLIAPGITLLKNAEYTGFRPKPIIIRLEDGSVGPDSFDHELIMVIEERDGLHVLTGCSHNGITNMVESVRKEFPLKRIQSVIGGFHLMNPGNALMTEEADTVRSLALALQELDILHIYTGHCTGTEAFVLLKDVLGERIQWLSTGKAFAVPVG